MEKDKLNVAKRIFVKLNVLLLIFGFLFQPPAGVFAQNETNEKPPTSIQISDKADKTKTQLDKALEEVQPKDENKNFEKEQSQEDSSAAEPVEQASAVEDEKTSNSNRITIDVDYATGAFSYKYKLDIPAGRNSLNPIIDLKYNSEDKNNASEIGFGWSLSIPKIKRLNKRGVNLLYESNDFYSSLSGELEKISESAFGAKIDDGSMLDYQLNNNVWTVTAKDGTKYIFGGETSAMLEDPSDLSKVYEWYLSRIEDTNGNFISYNYYDDTANNVVYPDSITYTNYGGSAGIYEIDFIKEARPDEYFSYAPGFLTKTTKRTAQIQVLTNGLWTRKYVLGYEQGDNGYRSMLNSVTEYGRDEAGAITALPEMSMLYSAGENSLVNNSNNNFPWPESQNQPASPFSLADGYLRVMDLNGDGLKDIAKSYNIQINGIDKPVFWVLVNTGHGWAQDTSWTQPIYSFVDGQGRTIEGKFVFSGIDTGDWNGDGKDDLIRFWREDLGGGRDLQHVVVLLNNGSGWTQDKNVSIDNITYSNACTGGSIYIMSGNSGGRFVDLNGDGFLDYVYAYNIQINGVHCPIFAVLYNEGGNLKWDQSVTVPWVNNGSGSAPLSLNDSIKALDLNGDGLLDFIWALDNSNPYFWVLINTGHGWAQDTSWTQPTYTYLSPSGAPQNGYFITSSGAGWRPMEINGDNLVDFVRLWTIDIGGGHSVGRSAVLVNTGHGWAQNDSLLAVGNYTASNNATGYPITTKMSATIIFDANGDGMDDIMHTAVSQTNGVYDVTDWLMQNTGHSANLVEKITLPEGGNFSFDYKASTSYTDQSGNLLNPNLPITYNTLKSVTSNDGFGNQAVTTYEYADGSYFYNNVYDRRFAGYGKITVQDPVGNKTIIYNHLGNGLQAGETGSDPADGSLIGKAYKTQRYDASGNLFSEAYTDWVSYDLGNNRDFTYKAKEVSNESGKQSAVEYIYNTTTGNLTNQTNYGKVLALAGNFTDIEADKRAANYTYTAAGPILPSTLEILNHTGNKVSQQKFYYDNQPLGAAVKGNQTKIEFWLSGGAYINSQKTYTNNGLVKTETDPMGNVTEYFYDAYDMYPEVVTNPLSQSAYYVYDYGIGKPKQITDANGNIFKNYFDGLGRILRAEQPDETNPAVLVIKTSYIYNNASQAVSIQKTDYLDSSNFVSSYNYYDGLGRIIQTKKSAENNNFSTKDFVYDNRGNLQKESLPYFSNISARTASSSTSQLYTTYVYDALNRKISETNAVGATSFAYQNWQTTITDANNKQKDYVYDAYNNLIQVKEHKRAYTYITSYVYDAAGNLINITDALGNVRNFSYDKLGRRLTSQDLRSPADSVFGAWRYFYDRNGNLISSINPERQIIVYTYDALNRKTSENDTSQTGAELVLRYDDCKNGAGKLCYAAPFGLKENFEYSPTGNTTKDTKRIADTFVARIFATEYAYDRQGNQTLITNPDLSQIKYQYNMGGYPEKVLYKESSGADFAEIVSNFDYTSAGQISDIYYATGAHTTNTYDANKLYRLTKKLSVSGDVNLQDISYQYDNVGNIKQIIDNSSTDARKTVVYVYDDLYRLTSASATNTANSQNYTESFVYDAIGNILSKKINGEKINYRYKGNLNNTGSDYANPDAATEIAGDVSTSYKYDRNGNMTGQGLNIYKYDYNNRLLSFTAPGDPAPYDGRIDYAYDHTGQRIKTRKFASDGIFVTYYPTMYYNKLRDEITKHIFANGLNLATIEVTGDTAKTYFNFSDSLQSSSVMTDQTGAVVETMDYYPFGEIRLDSKTADFAEQRKYIGQEYDEDTGLNYLNARYYNSAIARFVTQDPMFWNFDSSWLADPQNQNAYAYARNNPITLSDPSGEKAWIESKSVFDVRGNAVGIHTYFKAVPNHPDEINIQGLPKGAEGFTMGGYNSSNFGPTNKLIKNMGTTETSWDKDTAFGDGVKINSMEINPPEGQNDTQFINNLGKIYNETDLSGMNYFSLGNVRIGNTSLFYDANCNNFSYTLGVKAGVKDQMDSFDPGPGVSRSIGEYGYKTTLPTTSVYREIKNQINSLKERVGSFISSLNK
ncbi:MAG: hypothetical protein A2549_00380 [Candidatus Staskawiczbacteria bacterium RIFOXYD2_FULL_37_10]|nr:MAG: hypothetical protein A2549_00380 [Candidatus Staskawiczbacteria bacterium RIFOXYD2_FULL_37_10]